MTGRTKRRPAWLTRRSVADSPAPDHVTIDVTTEVRWFFDGPLPDEVRRWFTRDGTAGMGEHRTDLYRLGPHEDMGVKRRSGTVLELKLRLGESRAFELDDRRAGVVERWQRWSPADERVSADEHASWGAVDKAIVKRRFEPDGHERKLTEADRPMTGVACDVEIVDIRRDGESSWSFAFAAFGPLDTHHRSLAASWETLRRTADPPDELRLVAERSCGYPAWLAVA